jgi:hypothetical protein
MAFWYSILFDYMQSNFYLYIFFLSVCFFTILWACPMSKHVALLDIETLLL